RPLRPLSFFLLLQSYAPHLYLLSFPTRRSSDLVHIYCTIYNKVLNRSSASIYRPKCWSKRLKILKVPDLTLINLSCSPAQCRIYHNTPINNLILLPVLSLFTISKIFLRYCDKFTQDCNRTDTLSSLKNTLLSLAIKAEIVG